MKPTARIVALFLFSACATLLGCDPDKPPVPDIEPVPQTQPESKPDSKPAPAVFVLLDAEKFHEKNPDTFWIPPKEERLALKKDQLVKLVLEVPPGAPPRKHSGERMWFAIEKVSPGPRFVGRLENDPIIFTELKAGETRVDFGPQHVIQIWEEKKETSGEKKGAEKKDGEK